MQSEFSSYPDVVQRFLRYVQIHTTSDENNENIPSTPRQFDLANLLVKELHTLGISDAYVNENSIVMATLPSNLPNSAKSVPIIAFIAHLDTSYEESGENVIPRIISAYDGGVITFPQNPALLLTPGEFPVLINYKKQDIITASGSTLLGADDKAGIAEIMATIAHLVHNPSIPHGTIRIVFTPDEETGNGVHAVDVDKIGADFGYTLDGSEIGEFEAACFNAYNGKITIQGYNIHPGYAYKKMINAVRIAGEVLQLFPNAEAPETTQNLDGFYHPLNISGDINHSEIKFILRDFNAESLQKRVQYLKNGLRIIESRYSGSHLELSGNIVYRNMKEIIDSNSHVALLAITAMQNVGVQVIEKPIRGGTDGAQLSFRGLPCPNIFTGAHAFHSKKEFIPIPSMEKAVQVLLEIIKLATKPNQLK